MKQMEIQILEISKVNKEKLNGTETESFILSGRDALGLVQVTIRNPEGFDDLKAGQLVRLNIDKPQMTIDEFEAMKPRKNKPKDE